MKEILKNFLAVSLVIIAYFAVRFMFSLYPGRPAFGWDTAAILGVVIAILIFAIQNSIKPERSLFVSWGFMIFFVAGSLFWTTSSSLISYSLLAAIAIFFLFSLLLFFISFKAIKKESEDRIAKNVGNLLAMCAVYLIIIPAVALAEIIF
ncbi:MAG TPA: hypothetical protein VFD51_02490 [Patescibacteria group bacterium]|nr:hypothetical protein [Patescibacteria group bacterium]